MIAGVLGILLKITNNSKLYLWKIVLAIFRLRLYYYFISVIGNNLTNYIFDK